MEINCFSIGFLYASLHSLNATRWLLSFHFLCPVCVPSCPVLSACASINICLIRADPLSLASEWLCVQCQGTFRSLLCNDKSSTILASAVHICVLPSPCLRSRSVLICAPGSGSVILFAASCAIDVLFPFRSSPICFFLSPFCVQFASVQLGGN